MKDLGHAKRNLGIHIIINKAARTLFVSKERYIAQVIESFGMLDSNSVKNSQFKSSTIQAPMIQQDKLLIDEVPYS